MIIYSEARFTLNTFNNSEAPIHIDQEVDIIEYLQAILAAKYRITIFAILAAATTFGVSYLVPERFSAMTTVALNITEKPGNVAEGTYRGSDVIGLLEYDLLIDSAPDNEADRTMARLRSFDFRKSVIDQHNLLPIIFPSKWNEVTGTWTEDFKPDLRVAVSNLGEMILVAKDPESGLVHITGTTTNPQLSADLVNLYTGEFNGFIRLRQLEEISQRREYLNRRLTEVNNLELQKSIYRLLETQIAQESLIFARQNYPLEVIQPATVPLFKSSPARKKWTILAFLGAVFFGITIALGAVLLRKIITALTAYKPEIKNLKEGPTTTPESEWID